MLKISLPTPHDTAHLGTRLAHILRQTSAVRALLLRGPLGSGKTALTRALVAALPGGADAEVSSPSFTLCNVYPTTPPVVHCDLYRAETALPEEVWELLDDAPTSTSLAVIEWAEFIPAAALPGEYLDICLETCKLGRLATVEPHGKAACGAVMQLQHDDWTT